MGTTEASADAAETDVDMMMQPAWMRTGLYGPRNTRHEKAQPCMAALVRFKSIEYQRNLHITICIYSSFI